MSEKGRAGLACAWLKNVVWLGFASGVNSYANEWEGHPNHWGTTHSSIFWQCLRAVLHLWVCHLAYRLGIRLTWIWLVILDPIDFNWFTLCPCVMSFFQRLCPAPAPPPVSCSFPQPCPSPQCRLYNLMEGQPENSWPLGGKYCIISNPSRYSALHLPRFLQHVQPQHFSVKPLGWVTGTQSLLEVHLLLASLQGQLAFQGQCLPLWELALQAVWAQTFTTFLKLQT